MGKFKERLAQAYRAHALCMHYCWCNTVMIHKFMYLTTLTYIEFEQWTSLKNIWPRRIEHIPHAHALLLAQ